MDESEWNLEAMAQRALSEIGAVFQQSSRDLGERMCAEILRAGRITCYGVGREGLMMKALCMRLMHLGLNAHVAGDQLFAFGANDGIILRQHGELGIFAQIPLKGRQLAERSAPLGADEQLRRRVLDPASQLAHQ